MLTHDQIISELCRQIDAKLVKQVDIAAQMNIPASRVAEMRKGIRRVQPHEMPVLAEILGMISPSGIIKDALGGVTRIPILGKVAAGVWLEQSVIETDNEDFVSYDNISNNTDASNLFAVVTEGDSMNLAFPANAILICRHIRDGFVAIRKGDYVVVERENHDLREMTCKRIEIASNGDFLLVSESSNPKYAEPIRVERSKDDNFSDMGINIVGKLVRIVVDFER